MKGYLIERNITLSELPSTLKSGLPLPIPGPGQILVSIHTSAFNYFDLLQIQGLYQHQPPHPYIAGAEFSGTLHPSSPIPEGCNWIPGKTRVFGAGQGAYAEVVKVDWKGCVEVPEGMAEEEASGLFVTYPTSYAGLVFRAKCQPGETVLIHASAGGVGLAALQIAKALGCIVIATAGSPEKLAICKKFGADHVVDYRKQPIGSGRGKGNGGWMEEVLTLTGGKGVDVIYDPVGLIIPSLKCIAWNGRAIVVGFAGGNIEKIPANLILLKNISIVGVHWGAYTKNESESIPVVWAALLKLLREGKIKGIVYDKIYEGLEQVPAGLAALGNRETWGKAVVRINVNAGKEGSKI